MSLVRLELQRGLGRHLRAGHPWVFRKALEHLPRLPPGSVMDLTEAGKIVARGYYDPLSPIAVRVLTRDPRETIDGAFYRAPRVAGLGAPGQLLDRTDTDAFRLIHGEADGLRAWWPTSTTARWASRISAGLTPVRGLLVDALAEVVPGVRGVLRRDELGGDDGDDGAPGGGKVLQGEAPPDPVVIRERGVRFGVDVRRGQKTGFFLDQRENRAGSALPPAGRCSTASATPGASASTPRWEAPPGSSRWTRTPMPSPWPGRTSPATGSTPTPTTSSPPTSSSCWPPSARRAAPSIWSSSTRRPSPRASGRCRRRSTDTPR